MMFWHPAWPTKTLHSCTRRPKAGNPCNSQKAKGSYGTPLPKSPFKGESGVYEQEHGDQTLDCQTSWCLVQHFWFRGEVSKANQGQQHLPWSRTKCPVSAASHFVSNKERHERAGSGILWHAEQTMLLL